MEYLYWIDGRNQKRISVMAHIPTKTADPVCRRPVIIYCHGFTANRIGDNRMGIELARTLCNEGYLLIRFDFIGSGESEGEFKTDTYFSGWLEDLNSVLDWIPALGQADTQRIGLIGHSLGGAIVTHLAASDDRIKAVCALAPVTHLERNFKESIIGPSLWKRAIDGHTIQNFYNKKYSLSSLFVQDLLKYDIPARARQITSPFLIVHGEEDAAVPVHDSHDLMGYLSTPDKNLVIFQDEGHLFTPQIHPALIEWFNAKL